MTRSKLNQVDHDVVDGIYVSVHPIGPKYAYNSPDTRALCTVCNACKQVMLSVNSTGGDGEYESQYICSDCLRQLADNVDKLYPR